MLHLLSLPDIVLEKILSYLCYDDIAKQRIICRQFDAMCKQLLNKGFISAEKYHSQCLKSVKSQLPRRESERRSHPMARHCDILTAIETRISMLSMTFMKYVDVGMCCFIPGKVIDEIFRVLRLLKVSKTPPRAHEILQELRDISSMAMEHFDEKIVPGLKHKVALSRVPSSLSPSGSSLVAGSSHGSPMFTQERIRLHFHKLQSCTKRNKSVLDKLVLKVKRQNFQLSLQGSKLRDQAHKLSEKDTQIAELKRHVEELDHKFGDLAAELSRAREEKGALAESPSMTCGTKRKFFTPLLSDHLDENTKKFKPPLECPSVTEETHEGTLTESSLMAYGTKRKFFTPSLGDHLDEKTKKFKPPPECPSVTEETHEGTLAESSTMAFGTKLKFYSPILGDHLDEKTKRFKPLPECPLITEETHD